MFALAAYPLPVTAGPNLKPFALLAIEVKDGHPLACMLAE